MKFVQVSQGSDEWHELRRTKIGASNSPALLGVHPYKKPIDVYNEMVLGKVPYLNQAMRYGMENEEIARIEFMQKTGTLFIPAVVTNDKYPFLMASLDGLSENKKDVLEIKCPQERILTDCLLGFPPIYWEYQVLHQLLVSDAEMGHLYIWNEDGRNCTFSYRRDYDKMFEILKVCETFYHDNLVEFQPPEKR